jgi:hypothetical protein
LSTGQYYTGTAVSHIENLCWEPSKTVPSVFLVIKFAKAARIWYNRKNAGQNQAISTGSPHLLMWNIHEGKSKVADSAQGTAARKAVAEGLMDFGDGATLTLILIGQCG